MYLRKSENKISDLFDGEIYKKFSKNFDIQQLDYIFSMIFNTDGISVSDKSNISLWPVYFKIAEIDKDERFCFENTIIGGNFA